MATDISTVKSTIPMENGASSTKTAIQKNMSGIDFAEIIRKNGSNMDRGLNALSDRAGITGVGERPENAPASDDHAYDHGEDRHDLSDSRADSDDPTDHGADRQVSSSSDHADDYRNAPSQDSSADTADASSRRRDGSQHTDNHGENASRDDRSTDSSKNDTGSSDEGAGSESANAANTGENDQSSVKGDEATHAKQSGGNEHAQNAGTAATAKQMINSLLSNAQETAVSGQGNAQAQTATDKTANKAAATEGLGIAAENIGKNAKGDSAGTGQSGLNQQNAQARTQTHNTANTQTQAQGQNTATVAVQTADETQTKQTSKAAEQSAQLSRMVGNGNKVDVNVSVTDEKATLVSKPTSSLTSNTVLASDSTAPSLRSQQGQNGANANANAQAQQVAGQAAGTQAQVQQATQQVSGGQAQTTAATAIDAKGPTQATLHTGGSQTAMSGTGDTPVAAAPNSVSAAQASQQTASTQAANTPRFTLAQHAVADQVSVQITKALNAGSDKISIHLKPAELGRVDVQMEVGHDGRVTAVVTADNKNTLDLLQKDSKELQQALQQAGLQADQDSLSFNLREQGDGKQMAGKSSGGEGGLMDEGEALSLEEELAGVRPDIITDTRVDVSA